MTEEPKWRRKQRYPKILADEVLWALRNTNYLGHEKTMELLKRYRESRMRMIADLGLRVQPEENTRYFKNIPTEHFDAIRRLDTAFGKLHKYNHGGAADYAAADVERFMNSEIAQQPRKREMVATDEEIAAFLARRNYQSSDDKKELVDLAISEFGVGESKVRKAARKHGLTGNKKTTVR